ncbi:MAG: hypothetical protein JWP01_2599 [Myxococcales bacterium]|nr:hypothetical protein [Myxococcales bacterium]
MSGFKKAIQVLTTTVVKAESADQDSPQFASLKTEGLAQLEQLLTMHAVLALGGDGTDDSARKHEGWFLQTVNRAREIFGVSA